VGHGSLTLPRSGPGRQGPAAKLYYGIVKQSGGFIGLESEIGRGATFAVDLPAVAEDPPNRPS